MSLVLIRAAIVSIMQAVPDIGVVHAYERYAKNIADLAALYRSAPHQQLRGWYVGRNKTAERDRVQNTSTEYTVWKINGFMALSDENQSELQMDLLIEALRDTFRVNDTLNDTVAQCSLPSPGGGSREASLQLLDFGPVMFGAVLCHGVRLQLNTIRYLTRTV